MGVYNEMVRRHPELRSSRRTMERSIRNWKALDGPNQDVIFRQQQIPGRLGLSDSTDISDVGITIAEAPAATARRFAISTAMRRKISRGV